MIQHDVGCSVLYTCPEILKAGGELARCSCGNAAKLIRGYKMRVEEGGDWCAVKDIGAVKVELDEGEPGDALHVEFIEETALWWDELPEFEGW